MESGEVECEWPTHPALFLHQVIAIVTQSYYGDPENGGNRDGVSWDRIGFRPGPKRPVVEPDLPPLQVTDPRELDRHYDAVVVGAGAGGGVVACMLAEGGRRVLLLERGEALTAEQVSTDHLRNHRLALYGHNTGPPLEGHPRVLENRGVARVMRPFEHGYHNNAMTVGGGTRVYEGQAWRFAPQDFRMASLYGVPEGSSLADWPIDYETLAPFYELAENEIGVSGELGHSHAGPRNDYPMPPVEPDFDGPVLSDAAQKLGWKVRAVPLAINTEPRHGRPACVAMGTCCGFACPTEARGNTANTVIPRALATGNCQLVTGAQASRIEVDERGRARAVHFFHEAGGEPTEKRIEADLSSCPRVPSRRRACSCCRATAATRTVSATASIRWGATSRVTSTAAPSGCTRRRSAPASDPETRWRPAISTTAIRESSEAGCWRMNPPSRSSSGWATTPTFRAGARRERTPWRRRTGRPWS